MKKVFFLCMVAGLTATACNLDWFKKNPKQEEEIVTHDDSVQDSTFNVDDSIPVVKDTTRH